MNSELCRRVWDAYDEAIENLKADYAAGVITESIYADRLALFTEKKSNYIITEDEK